MQTQHCAGNAKFPLGVFALPCLLAGLAGVLTLRASVGWADGIVTECTETALRTAMTGGGTVTFACDGTIPLGSSITVAADTACDGQGRHVTISGNNLTRVFSVNTNVRFTLINLMIVNGLAATGGAGVRNEGGTVNATNCAFHGNEVVGADGPSYGANGASAVGGAIHNSGAFNASACTFDSNRAVGGRGADGISSAPTPITTVPGGVGGQGLGGAIYNLGTMTIERCLFASNSVVGGSGGRGSDESASQPYSGDYGAKEGSSGGSALGGSLFNGGAASLVNCTLAWNCATAGDGGQGGMNRPSSIPVTRHSGIGGNGGEACGGICGTNSLALINCTVASNAAIGGRGADAGPGTIGTLPGLGGYGGGGLGGVFCAGGVTRLVNSIAALNSGVGGPGGYGCAHGTCGYGSTGGSIGNFLGAITDLGHNLSSDGTAGFTASGSMQNTDPKLGPLAVNGGSTLTMALLLGSPAIDAGDTATAPAIDQRGFPRPAGLAADIGAYESSPPPRLRIRPSQAGVVEILLYDASGSSCRLLTSATLATWRPIATNQIGPDGTSLFKANLSPGDPDQFFRVVVP